MELPKVNAAPTYNGFGVRSLDILYPR